MTTTSFDVLKEQARSVRIEDEIAARGLKLKRSGGEWVGPCPICGGKDRFAVNPKKKSGLWICRGCGKGGDVIDLFKHLEGVGYVEACRRLANGPASGHYERRRPARQHLDVEQYDRERRRIASWLWSQRQPIAGTPAERYLREARGIACPLPPTLAYLPPSKKYPHPTMLACFGLCDEPEPGVIAAPPHVNAIHRTYLRANGLGKADVEKPKKLLGFPGALPIVIAPPNDLLGLAICEGIEDGLSIYEATGLGVWVAGSAGRMPALAEIVPNYIEEVTISADADDAGRRGSDALAERLDRRSIKARVV